MATKQVQTIYCGSCYLYIMTEADSRLPKTNEPSQSSNKRQKTSDKNEEKEEPITLKTLLTAIQGGKNDKSGKKEHSSSPADSKPKSSPGVCKHFQRGFCKKGDNCTWSHSTDNNNANIGSSKPKSVLFADDGTKLCHYVIDRGYCTKNEECPFAATHWRAYQVRLSGEHTH